MFQVGSARSHQGLCSARKASNRATGLLEWQNRSTRQGTFHFPLVIACLRPNASNMGTPRSRLSDVAFGPCHECTAQIETPGLERLAIRGSGNLHCCTSDWLASATPVSRVCCWRHPDRLSSQGCGIFDGQVISVAEGS